MRRGFTLLELMIVIIIVGVLATLGIMQYQAAVERARGAEARQVLSTLRSICASFYLQEQNTALCTNNAQGVNSGSAAPIQGQLPGDNCWTTNYFQYNVDNQGGGNSAQFTATRCTGTSKNPPGGRAGTLVLTTNYNTGADVWSGDGGY